jgi:hypothetical protein
MRKTLLCVGLATAFIGIGSSAQSAMPKMDTPSIESVVQQVICIGNRRNFRNFNHCVRVLGSRNSNHCSRICRR